VSALEGWLAERSAARAESGTQRELVARDPDPDVVDLAGNDYLGLSRHPDVTAAAADATLRWGAGAGSSRLVSGTLRLHESLEQRLGELLGHEVALVTSTGYHANLAAVTALADEGTLVVSDAHVHASLVDGCRLARGAVVVVPHRDVAAVDDALRTRSQPRAMVLTESVFSVLGDAAPLIDLARTCRRHDATLLVDEAHALGVAGRAGLGLVADLGIVGPGVVVTVTLSKALGSQGGAVLASRAVVDHLVNTARPFIFDTGLAPPATAAAQAALDVLLAEPERVGRVRRRAGQLAVACEVAATAGAIVPVPMPSAAAAVAAQRQLREQGLLVGCFRPPSVPDRVSRLRLTANATLTEAAVAHATQALQRTLASTDLETSRSR